MILYMNTPRKLWFKRKLYGWGWTPCTWQGWVSVLVFIVLVYCLFLQLNEQSTGVFVLTHFTIPVFVLVMLFIWLGYAKGEKPRWQWGNRK